jgi:hypothetical protein
MVYTIKALPKIKCLLVSLDLEQYSNILKQGCFETARIVYIISGVLIRMVLKNIKEIMRTVIGKRSLQSETIKEIANLLHDLEFLMIKVMIFAIGIHQLYVYTMKTVF